MQTTKIYRNVLCSSILFYSKLIYSIAIIAPRVLFVKKNFKKIFCRHILT